MKTYASHIFFLAQKVENGECKLNLGSHDKKIVYGCRETGGGSTNALAHLPTLCYPYALFNSQTETDFWNTFGEVKLSSVEQTCLFK